MTQIAKRESSAVADPRTGEVIDVATIDHQALVGIFLATQDYERRVREWRQTVEDELVRRHGDRRAAEVVGDHEVDVERGFSRVWDADDLADVLVDLLMRDKLSVEDVQGVVVQQEPKVDGRKAVQLLNRADEDTLIALRRCFRWEQRGRARVKVTPVASLESGE
jgi:hypothetical protein